MTDTIFKKLQILDHETHDCYGQGYDNGAKMVGVNSGVKTKISTINPRFFCTAYGCQKTEICYQAMAPNTEEWQSVFLLNSNNADETRISCFTGQVSISKFESNRHFQGLHQLPDYSRIVSPLSPSDSLSAASGTVRTLKKVVSSVAKYSFTLGACFIITSYFRFVRRVP